MDIFNRVFNIKHLEYRISFGECDTVFGIYASNPTIFARTPICFLIHPVRYFAESEFTETYIILEFNIGVFGISLKSLPLH